MNTFFHKLKLIFTDKSLRNRVLFVLAALAVFRLLAAVPIPGVDTQKLNDFFANNQFLGFMNIFSGGGLSNLSIAMLGVGPYITASIIMQLMTVISPKLKEMHQEEGDAGRIKFAQWSRYLSVPLALIQAFGLLILLQKQGIIASADSFAMLTNVLVVVAGSILLMWIGELVTEFGIGNGVSLIIFAGIVARIPTALGQIAYTFDIAQAPMYLGVAALTVVITAAVVFITESERPIPITYARQSRAGVSARPISTYLPLRVNQAGVIPIIFAMSILLFPQMAATFFASSSNALVANMATKVTTFLANGMVYGVLYFVLVFLFTYFYTAVTFEPKKISDNLQKSGAFIPGVRPGEQTIEYIGDVATRITLVGAIFLGVIAVLPLIVQGVTGVSTIAVGGTAMLIAVSVVLDIIKKTEAQISIREY